jgi:hypothetical protein
LISNEGFSIKFGHKTVTYADARRAFSFGLEGGFLFPKPYQVNGETVSLTELEIDEIIRRVLTGIRFEGADDAQVYRG